MGIVPRIIPDFFKDKGVEAAKKALEKSTEAGALEWYGTKVGAVGKAVPIVGSVVGVGVDMYRDSRISRVEKDIVEEQVKREHLEDALIENIDVQKRVIGER